VPTGKSPSDVRNWCQAAKAKYFALPEFRFTVLRFHPGPREGRFAIVTIRWVRVAMAVAASGDLTGRKRCGGRRSRVVLTSRVFPESFQRQITAQTRRAGLGLSSTVFSEYRQCYSDQGTIASSAHEASRKAIARGKPGRFGCTCSLPPCFLLHGDYGRSRLSLRPLQTRGSSKCHNPGSQAAGTKAFARDRACVRSSRQGMNPPPHPLREGLCEPPKRNCDLPLTS